jgi:hypothetical protein
MARFQVSGGLDAALILAAVGSEKAVENPKFRIPMGIRPTAHILD